MNEKVGTSTKRAEISWGPNVPTTEVGYPTLRYLYSHSYVNPQPISGHPCMTNLERIRANYLYICAAILVFGAASDYLASSIYPAFKAISFIDDKGQVTQKQFLSFPISYSVLRIAGSIFYTLAISIFISVFVTDRIKAELDRKRAYELRQLQEAVNINIFDTLFKTIIPEEIFAVIKSSVIQTRTVRRDANWIYDFIEADEEYITLRQTISYELHNISSEEISEPTKADFSTFGDTTQSLERAVCEIDEHPIVVYDRNNPQNNVGLKITEDKKEEKTFIEYNVNIAPYKHAYFTMVFRNRYRYSVQDEYFTKTALIRGTVTANFPPDYEFKVYADMSSKMRCILDENTRRIFKFEGAILPHEGYVYYMHKKDRIRAVEKPLLTKI